MSKHFHLLKRLTFPLGDTDEQYGWQILYFHIGRFSFNWFTEYGEWFIYFYWNGNEKEHCMRLSSAGNYVQSYTKDIEP